MEEKRVNVIAYFVDSPDGLADGYRVETRIVTWESTNVLKIPSSATFRERGGWSVFVVENGRARRRGIEVGHRTQTEIEVLAGMAPGERVVLHPSNELADGVRVHTQ